MKLNKLTDFVALSFSLYFGLIVIEVDRGKKKAGDLSERDVKFKLNSYFLLGGSLIDETRLSECGVY